MSPAKILIALAAIAFVGVAAYVASIVLPRSPPAPTASQPRTEKTTQTAPKATTQAASFHAIVERNGAVVLCVSNGEILFPDRCAGTGRLSIVQPIEEGEVVWVSATGVVSMENESPQNPDCALSRAKWDPKTEQVTSIGRKIRIIPAAAVAQQLNKVYSGRANLVPDDVTAFGFDLDNDGSEEIVYVANSVPRLADLNEKTQRSYPYFVQGGIFRGRSPSFPSAFFHETGEYQGGTDAIGQVMLKGIVPIAGSTGELALLARTGWGVAGDQKIVRVSTTGVQSIESFEFRCN